MISNIEFSGLTIVALGVILISVVLTDIKSHRISNAMVMMIVLLGLISQLFIHGVDGIMQGLGGMAVGLGLFLPFYIGGGMGAGDVKLMGSIGTVLGPVSTLLAGGAALLAGVPLALFCLAQRHQRTRNNKRHLAKGGNEQRIASAIPHPARKERLPYAAAIAAGTVVGLWHSGQIQNFIGAIS